MDGFDPSDARAAAAVIRAASVVLLQSLTPEGIEGYDHITSETQILARSSLAGFFARVIRERPSGRLLAYAEWQISEGHLVLIFVHPDVQGQGLGHLLLEDGISTLPQRHPGLVRITVNSAPESVGFYRRHRFRPDSGMQWQKGVPFIRMSRPAERTTMERFTRLVAG